MPKFISTLSLTIFFVVLLASALVPAPFGGSGWARAVDCVDGSGGCISPKQDGTCPQGFSPGVCNNNPQCLCADDFLKINNQNYNNKQFTDNIKISGCLQIAPGKDCTDRKTTPEHTYDTCSSPPYPNYTACNVALQLWNQHKADRIKSGGASAEAMSGSIAGNIPNCLLTDELTPECRDVGVFIKLFINWARGSFAILGTFALAYFVYGGFNMILSQGNPEKVKKGTDAMIAAVIGLFICFMAYLVVKFLGDAVGLKSQFKLL